MNMWSSTVKTIVLFIAIGFFVYLPTLFGAFIWDDEDFVHQNQYVKEFRFTKFFRENAIAGRGKISNYYRPVQLTYYALIHNIFGFNPFWYHAGSVMLHVFTAIVVFLFLKLFLKDAGLAFLIASLFLIHPVQTESVSYISGVSDPIFVLFLFLSLYWYLKSNSEKQYYLFSIGSFVLALLSKELAITGMGIIVLLFIVVRKKEWARDIPFLIVYQAIGLLYIVLRFTILQFQSIESIWKGTVYGSSLAIRLATFFHNFFTYLLLLVFPKDLFMERDVSVHVEQNIANGWTLIFLLFHITVCIVYKVLARNKNKHAHFILFFYTAFLLSMLPFAGVIPLNGIFYEHYLYLPMVFFWGCVFTVAKPLWQSKICRVALLIMVFLFIGRSYVRQYEWIDAVRFYEQTLRYAPKSTRVINNLGMELADRGKLDQAIATYEKGLTIDPSVPNFYHNLANTYAAKGNSAKAEVLYLKAIESDGRFYFSYVSLIQLYLSSGRRDSVLEFLNNKAIPSFPDNQYFQLLYNQLQGNKL